MHDAETVVAYSDFGLGWASSVFASRADSTRAWSRPADDSAPALAHGGSRSNLNFASFALSPPELSPVQVQ